jgi:23S rRNA (adenine2503-C2)-methyltransferase
MKDMGEPAFRGEQIFTWLQRDAATGYERMTNIGKVLRDKLQEAYPLNRLTLRKRQAGADGTIKYLFVLNDGVRIESVLMSHREETGHIRRTVCLSTQAGCAMGCAFCSTAGIGYRRNLTAGEIVGQALEIAAAEKEEIHNLVYMGMGEPLMNEEAVKKSILLLNHPLGQNIGARRMTVSTCGLPEGIRRFAEWGIDAVLAVSLHAADDETRDRLMPVNRRYPLGELLAACRDYHATTGRRITFEYVMIEGVNTSGHDAKKLAGLLKGIPCNINLIPVNPGPHAYRQPGAAEQNRFVTALEREGLDPVVRQERGRDIDGACGQLAAKSPFENQDK